MKFLKVLTAAALLVAFFSCQTAALPPGMHVREKTEQHSRLQDAAKVSRVIFDMLKHGKDKLSKNQIQQYLYEQYFDGKFTSDEVWDAVEYFKLSILPDIVGNDKRFAKVEEELDDTLRHKAASEVANEDHDEYVVRELHKLYKKYKIKPRWPKSVKRNQAPNGFARIPKNDL